jgi:hypothetical protein
MCTHLKVARGRNHIGDDEFGDLTDRYVVIGKRLTRWIQELVKEDRKIRG